MAKDSPKYSLEPVEGDPFEGSEGVAFAAPAGPPAPELTEDDKAALWRKTAGAAPFVPPSGGDDTVLRSAEASGAYDRGTPVFRGDLLPLTVTQDREVHFDPRTGLMALPPALAKGLLGLPKALYDTATDLPALSHDLAESGGLTKPTGPTWDSKPDYVTGRVLGTVGALGLGSAGFERPPNSLGIFGGQLSQGADKGALAQAQLKQTLRVDPAAIWRQHGWYKDVDGQWKYEIPDGTASLHPDATPENLAPGHHYALGDALQHPEFFQAYPEAKDWGLGFDSKGAASGHMQMTPEGPVLQLNPQLPPDARLGVALHELQHAVQEKEGFARGAAPATLRPQEMSYLQGLVPEFKELEAKGAGRSLDEQQRFLQLNHLFTRYNQFSDVAYQRYLASAGETEARNVQARAGMDATDSRSLHPDATADVPPGDRRVAFHVEGGPAAQATVQREGKDFVDTRGSGLLWHGTSRPDFAPVEGHFTPLNYYGQGLYATDAVDVAYGYSKRGSGSSGVRNLVQLSPKGPMNMIDGEAPLTPDLIKHLTAHEGPDGYVGMAVDNGAKNLREIYDEVREEATADGVSANEIQDIFEGMSERLQEAGYNGFTHKGGLRTDTPEHKVSVFFAPHKDLNFFKPSSFDPFIKKPELPSALSAPKPPESLLPSGWHPQAADLLHQEHQFLSPQLGPESELLESIRRALAEGPEHTTAPGDMHRGVVQEALQAHEAALPQELQPVHKQMIDELWDKKQEITRDGQTFYYAPEPTVGYTRADADFLSNHGYHMFEDTSVHPTMRGWVWDKSIPERDFAQERKLERAQLVNLTNAQQAENHNLQTAGMKTTPESRLQSSLEAFDNNDPNFHGAVTHLLAKGDMHAPELLQGLYGGKGLQPTGMYLGNNMVDMSSVIGNKRAPFGHVQRTFDTANNAVEHEYFEVNDAKQGKGLGKKILASQMALYQRLGLDKVNLYANIDVGSYAWAKYGFKPTQGAWDHLRGQLSDSSVVQELPEEVKGPVTQLLQSSDPTSLWHLADMKFPIQTEERGELPLGKALLLDRRWRGSLSLGDTEAMERFNAYVKKPRKAPRGGQ